MGKHEDKYCERCNQLFECKVGDVTHCQCYAVSLTPEESYFIGQQYSDCVCAACMLQMKFEYQQNIAEAVPKEAYLNWSSGKDAAFALWTLQQQGEVTVKQLLTSVNSLHNRISMHGVRRSLLLAQASAIGIPLQVMEVTDEPTMEAYEQVMLDAVEKMKAMGLQKAVFGDLFLEDLRQYREAKLQAVGVEAVFPLWQKDTRSLLLQMLAAGFKAIVVCVNDRWLDASFCGRIINEQFLQDLPPDVDPCGENGEFHSFVFDGPIFQQPVPFTIGEKVYRSYKAPSGNPNTACKGDGNYGFWFCDLVG